MSLKKCPCCEKITLDAESLYEVCSVDFQIKAA